MQLSDHLEGNDGDAVGHGQGLAWSVPSSARWSGVVLLMLTDLDALGEQDTAEDRKRSIITADSSLALCVTQAPDRTA